MFYRPAANWQNYRGGAIMTHEERMYLTYLRFPNMRPKGWKPKGEDDIPPEPDIHGDICPHCGQKTLLHEEGCVKCTSCAWSMCG